MQERFGVWFGLLVVLLAGWVDHAAAQEIQSPESLRSPQDCVLGDWPTVSSLPCGTSRQVTRLVARPATGNGRPCPTETKTIFSTCTPTPTQLPDGCYGVEFYGRSTNHDPNEHILASFPKESCGIRSHRYRCEGRSAAGSK